MNNNKLIWITGGGRGIGRVVCRALAQEGYRIATCARNKNELIETAQGFEGQILTHVVDVTQKEKIDEWMEEILEKNSSFIPFGLITLAGIHGAIGPFIDTDFDLWKEGIEVNLYGSLFPAQKFAKIIREKKLPGRVLFFSGGAATKAMPFFSSYGASKTALIRVCETLALEWKELGISVNAIAPGAVATRLQNEVIEKGILLSGAQRFQEANDTILKGGTPPEKAAQLCSFLLKPESGSMTGRLFSAVWDDVQSVQEHWDEIKNTDLFQLRRMTEKERPLSCKQR